MFVIWSHLNCSWIKYRVQSRKMTKNICIPSVVNDGIEGNEESFGDGGDNFGGRWVWQCISWGGLTHCTPNSWYQISTAQLQVFSHFWCLLTSRRVPACHVQFVLCIIILRECIPKISYELGVLAKLWIILDIADDWCARATKLSNNHPLRGQMQFMYIIGESSTKIGNVRTDVQTDIRPDLSQWEFAMSMRAIHVRARLFSPALSSTKQDVMQDCLT